VSGATLLRIGVVVVNGLVALTAIPGAIWVVPTMPMEWMRSGPFADWTIPAVALAFVGVLAAVAAVLGVVRPWTGALASIVAGTAMIVFELVEVAVVGWTLSDQSLSGFQKSLQLVYLVVGAMQVALGAGLWLATRRTAPRLPIATAATAALTASVGVLAGVAAALGVFARGDGSYATVTTARGEQIEIATTGVYANNAQQLVAEGVGWDIFTLVVSVPLLLLGAVLVGRGSFRGTLLAAGMLGYALYAYLEYAVTWAFGLLFPLHVAIAAMSVVALIGAGSLVATGLASRFSNGFPRRGWAALSVSMGVLLTVLWAGRIAEGLSASVPILHGETTMTVQALDLGLVVPMLLVLPILAWRRIPAAMAASTAFAVTFVTMSGAIASMMISSWLVTGVPAVPPIVTFSLACIAGLALLSRMFSSAALHDPSRTETHHVPGARPADLPATGLSS
jgi:hypothetical protein